MKTLEKVEYINNKIERLKMIRIDIMLKTQKE